MVKRWKDEIKLGLVLLTCSMFGGYFGAQMAQVNSSSPPVTYDQGDVFGTLPPPALPSSLEQAPIIVIVVNDTQRSLRHPEKALNNLPRPLNRIQRPVNFI